jgi:glycosyltransferase involved in cell wall biosynthesis
VRDYHVILHGIEAWRRVPYLDRLALRSAKHIIATTYYTAQECAKHNNLAQDRFRVIPLCADERNITPSATFRLNGEFKLLCVARQDAMERYKGFEHIFEALVILRPTHPNIHLNMVGTGDDQVRLKSVTRDLGVADMVTFWGALSDEDLAAAYRECDVYVMPSKKEGFGIVFLEAMRYGKPCIGGNHGGTPDVIEHGKNGYLVEWGAVEMMAAHIGDLAVNDSLRHSMGAAGRDRLLTKFSRLMFINRYSDLVC